MSKTVELSDQLVNDAKSVAEIFGRSAEGQIEFWVQLGRGVDAVLDAAQIEKLLQTNAKTEK